MSLFQSQTTRLFCASTFLLGGQFWRPVLRYLESENHGVSPETGVDMEIVAQVCEYARVREKRFENYLFISVLAALLLWLFDPVVTIVFFIFAATGIYFQKSYQERHHFVSRFRKNEFAWFNPEQEFHAKLQPVIKSALPAEDQNLIVYTG